MIFKFKKMTNVILLTIITVLLTTSIVLTSYAYSESLVITAETTYKEYRYNQIPSISGIVTDSDGNPSNRIQVFAAFPYVKAEKGIPETDENPSISTIIVAMTTFSDGKFLLQSLLPSPPGEHKIKVTAKQDNIEEEFMVTYFVKENPRAAKIVTQTENIENSSKPVDSENLSKIIDTDESQGTFDLLEQEIKFQKKEIKEKQNLLNKNKKSQQIIEQQRNLAQKDLESDLTSFEEKYESNSPRNVFASFIAQIDQTFRGLFWDQFEFTEKITQEAREAKIEALNQGKTSQEATKVFQKEAAVSQAEIIEYNKMLNIKYGFANQTTQDKFDEKGKIPRIED